MTLPTQNPSLAPDWLLIDHQDWTSPNGVTYTVAAGKKLAIPDNIEAPLIWPPYRGTGLYVSAVTFAFNLVSGQVNADIGVGNPSENDVPMRPYDGNDYSTPTLCATPGRYTLKRWDEILPNGPSAPVDPRCWQMNPGNTPGNGRLAWPWISPEVVEATGLAPAVVTNIQVHCALEQR